MRQILFRGKRKDNGQWVYGFVYQDESGCYIKESAKNMRFGCGCPVIPESVGQFTGLQDRYAKQIFDGDILSGWRKGSNSDREYKGYVFWQQEQAGQEAKEAIQEHYR